MPEPDRPFSVFGPSVIAEIAKLVHDSKGVVASILGSPPEPIVPAAASGGDQEATITQQADQVNHSEAAEKVAHAPTPKRGGTVNGRMLLALQGNYEEVNGWTCKQWAEHLKCGKSTVVETETWKGLLLARKKVQAERAKRTRRRPKGSELRRD